MMPPQKLGNVRLCFPMQQGEHGGTQNIVNLHYKLIEALRFSDLKAKRGTKKMIFDLGFPDST